MSVNIDATLLELPVQVCPYTDWYKFRRCVITTCKNYNIVTKCRCLGIDRVVPVGNKIISDAELNLYKFPESISTRLVSMRRKTAIDRVKHVLTLNKLIEYIVVRYRPGPLVYNTKFVAEIESAFPLKLNRLHFYNWMWPHLTDPRVWKKFISVNKGECSDLSVYTLLDMPREKYSALVEQIKKTKLN